MQGEQKKKSKNIIIWAAAAVAALLAGSIPVCASSSFYESSYQMPEEDAEDYTVLEELGEYEVCEGDCLWDIAEELLGSGENYFQLMEMNPDVIADPDLIYPHTCLRIRRKVYVRKHGGTAGTQMGEFRFGALPGCTVGIAQAGDAYGSFVFTGAEHEQVVCRIRDREQTGEDPLSDWEECRRVIEEYAEEHYGDRITDLTFRHYQSEEEHEIYLFSYVYTILGETYGLRGTLPIYVSHGICRTEHIQAEFVGLHTEEGMEEVIRYLTAGFEELPASGSGSVNDHNIVMEPSGDWELSEICNSFGWVEAYYDGIFRKASPAEPEERSARDRVLNSGG